MIGEPLERSRHGRDSCRVQLLAGAALRLTS